MLLETGVFILDALQSISESIFIGYGSPFYSYNVINNTGDIPSPILYMLSSGIVGLFFILECWS